MLFYCYKALPKAPRAAVSPKGPSRGLTIATTAITVRPENTNNFCYQIVFFPCVDEHFFAGAVGGGRSSSQPIPVLINSEEFFLLNKSSPVLFCL